MSRRLVPFVLALTGLVMSCGGDEADPVALVSSAPSTTSEAGTARMFVESAVSGMDRGGDLAATGEGLVDFERRRGTMTMQLPSAGELSLGEMEVVYEGTVIYYRASSLFPDAPTPWVSFDFARLSEAVTGTDLAQLNQSSTNDPSNALSMLNGASEVEELGTEEVRGVETTHYRATVDLRRALEEQEAVEDRQRFEQFLDQLGTEIIPVEVWLDDDGRARRMVFDQPLPDTPGAPLPEDAAMSMTIELHDFGVDVPVEIPPPSEVTDLTELTTDLAEDLSTTSTSA